MTGHVSFRWTGEIGTARRGGAGRQGGDRLGRSLLDLAGLMDKAGRHGWALVALDIGVDTASLSGKAVAGMMAVFAELERGMIELRTREALVAARKRGTVVGRRSTLPPEVIDRIVAEHGAGRSLRAIANGLNAEGIATGQGGRHWYASSVKVVLQWEPTGTA